MTDETRKMPRLAQLLYTRKFKISRQYYTEEPEKGLLIEYATKRGGKIGGYSEDDRFERGKAFGTVLNFFLYAVALGIRLEEKQYFTEEEKTETPFQSIEESRERHEIAPYLLMILLTKSGKKLIEIEQMNEEDLTAFASYLTKEMEAYAHAGFGIIAKYKAIDKSYFDTPDNFVNFLTDSK